MAGVRGMVSLPSVTLPMLLVLAACAGDAGPRTSLAVGPPIPSFDRPTPSPEPTGSLRGIVTFLAYHETLREDYAERAPALRRAIEEPGSPDELLDAANAILRWSGRLDGWLLLNSPESCTQAAWEATQRFADALELAGLAAYEWGYARGDPQAQADAPQAQSDAVAAADTLQAAYDLMATAVDAVDCPS